MQIRGAEADRDDDLRDANALPWMVDLLRRNPSYCHWGPYEDYMWTKDGGWNARVIVETWTEFGPWTLDDLNEVVHFYFYVARDEEECAPCGGSGFNPETKKIADAFYDFDGRGGRWCESITQDEADVLAAEGRIPKGSAAEAVNRAQARGPIGSGLHSHDAINRFILIEARAKRLGVHGSCAICNGRGSNFTAPDARLGLVLWVIHPRKGCSRGVDVKRLQEGDVSLALAFLREAAARNAERFSKLAQEISK